MENEEKLSLNVLEDRPYRYLQQMAKSIGLPSNFKKVYLIELIQAKKFKTEREVNTIIHRVKLERLQLSKARRESKRRKMQMTEVASTSRSCFSPPITMTPKRSNQMYVRCSPEQCRPLITYNPKRNLIQNLNQNPTPNSASSCGRILRSFNMKTLKPNYALMNGQDIFKSHTNPKETKIKIITNSGGFPQFNVTAKCVVKKHRPSVLTNGKTALKTHLMLTQSMDLLPNPIPAKRQRTLSGIYPLIPSDTIPRNLQTTESVCLRKIDGSLTKINALVQKRNIDIIPRQKNNFKNTEVNIQDILNSIDANTDHNTDGNRNNEYLQTQYPNLSSIDTVYSNMYNTQAPGIENNIKETDMDIYSVYYHKKIRAEQIRCQRLREMQHNERLPKIGDVFSKFSDVYRRDLTQPLYVQVSTEAERSQNHPFYVTRGQANTIMLEHLYNFKSQLITNAPLLQIATTSNTKCVYSTPIIATAVAQPSTIVSNEAYVSSFEVDSHRNQHDIDPRMYEFLHFSEQTRRNYSHCDDFSTSTSSLGTSQDISTTVSIPEMVEDALEIISQDGDYMEKIAMDVSVQCVLCTWAGPKILLEYHIKKEHAQAIHRQRGSEWAVPWAVPAAGAAGGAAGAARHLLQLGDALYVLSARYRDPDCFTACLASLSTESTQKFGSITIYNKVSGEPFSWSGHIQPLPPNLPYENEASCLKVELSKLDLLPNSANLKLFNRELVTDSPSKVIIGQPIFNDIQLIIFVRIFN
ncbi:uncharacterized protein LOC113397668 isoform X1 [Vanessa tameamea]|uniref:Uncharacterized protein LOC113397668 isoform X1 n=1 Tax=Vanessa tameamea TaxID=334116 RepID=A0ABM4ATY9_VANTA